MVRPFFKAPLDDRQDRIVYSVAFVTGASSILIVRIFGDRIFGTDAPLSLTDFVAILIAVAIIFLYTAYITISSDRSSISLDRAGDNAVEYIRFSRLDFLEENILFLDRHV